MKSRIILSLVLADVIFSAPIAAPLPNSEAAVSDWIYIPPSKRDSGAAVPDWIYRPSKRDPGAAVPDWIYRPSKRDPGAAVPDWIYYSKPSAKREIEAEAAAAAAAK